MKKQKRKSKKRQFILEERLSKLKIADIIAVASLWDINTDSTDSMDKKELIKYVAAHMRHKERIKHVIASLSEREKLILGVFSINSWSIEASYLYEYGIEESELGLCPYNVFSYDFSYYPRRSELKPKGLLGLLLLVRKRKYSSHGPIVYIVPSEFRDAIKAEFAARPSIEEMYVGDGDTRITIRDRRYEGYTLLNDLFTLLSLAATGIQLTPARAEIPKRTAEKIQEMLTVKSRDRLDSLIRLAYDLNLVTERIQNGKPVLMVREEAEKFLMLSREERVRLILDALTRYYNRAERAILHELKALEPDVWYDHATFYKMMRNLLLLRDEDRIDWLFEHPISIARSRVFKHLRQLGLLEEGKLYGGDSEAPREVFCLKPPLFGSTTEADRGGDGDGERGLIVQPNFEVIALPETSDYALFLLSRFAELKSIDRVRIFMLTRRALLNAMDNGITLAKMIEFLEREAKTEIPQNVLYTLKDWGEQYGRVELRAGLFLQADPELMAVIKEKEQIKRHLLKELSDSMVILDPSHRGVAAELIKEESLIYIEADDAVTATEVERAIGEYVVRRPSHTLFVIREEDVDRCHEALKKRGIFPRNYMLQSKGGGEGGEPHAPTHNYTMLRKRKRLLIEEAIRGEKMLRMVYLSGGYRETERLVVPYRVDEQYMEGYCHLREEHRVFRLDRIKWLEMV